MSAGAADRRSPGTTLTIATREPGTTGPTTITDPGTTDPRVRLPRVAWALSLPGPIRFLATEAYIPVPSNDRKGESL